MLKLLEKKSSKLILKQFQVNQPQTIIQIIKISKVRLEKIQEKSLQICKKVPFFQIRRYSLTKKKFMMNKRKIKKKLLQVTLVINKFVSPRINNKTQKVILLELYVNKRTIFILHMKIRLILELQNLRKLKFRLIYLK